MKKEEFSSQTCFNVEYARVASEISSSWEKTCKRLGLSMRKHVSIERENLYPSERQRVTVFVSPELRRRLQEEYENIWQYG